MMLSKFFRLKLLILFLLINTLPSFAYVSSLGNVTNAVKNGPILTLTIDNGTEPNNDILVLTVCSNNILKVDYRPNEVAESTDTPMLQPGKVWGYASLEINTTTNPITITTPNMIIEIAKTPCRINVKKINGTSLFWESSAGGVFYDGVKFIHPVTDNIYGIRGYNCNEDPIDILRNNTNHAVHAGNQGDSGGPFFWSTAGYGILVDSDGGYPVTESSTGRLEFYYGETPTEGRRFVKFDVEYYIMIGNPKEIMGSFAEITGKSPMFPKWALGFMNFEWGITETEMINMVDTYRAKNIPLDAYALDYDWKKYGDTNYGEYVWNTTNFPDANTTLKSTMDGKGVKLIGITKPRIVVKDAANGNRTTQYNDAEINNYWYPGHYEYEDYFIPQGYSIKPWVRSIDPYNENCRNWYWNHSKEAFDKGIIGWWNDETDKISSGSVSLWLGNFTTAFMSRALYEGQRNYSTKRVFQTARTFYPGAQRYATSYWTGDIGGQFKKGDIVDWTTGMQEQRVMMLSAINLGQARTGMDTGGFNPNSSNPTPELYARWMQFSTLVSVDRVHGNNNQQRQPWLYGNTAEEVSKASLHFRYSLLPYIYSYERNLYEKGVGLVRPLVFEYPTDNNVKNSYDEWMFGDWMLVSPVVDKDQTVKSVYLPAGKWIDYSRGFLYEGNKTIKYPLNAETWTDIPIFIKKGAIIPSQKVMDFIGQTSIDTIIIDVFPDTVETNFIYYDDAGNDYGYESISYFKQIMKAIDNGNDNYSFIVEAETGSYNPVSLQYYIAQIHGKASTSVTINGSGLTKYNDLYALKVATGEGWATGEDIYGDVTYVKIAAKSTSNKNVSATGKTSLTLTSLKYEAEDSSFSGKTVGTKAKINNNHGGFSGSGFVEGFSEIDAAATFYVKTNTSGDYQIGIRYANGNGSAKTISIFVNGTRVKQTSLPSLSNGNWDLWGTKNEVLPLTAGNNIITIKYYSDAGDTGNINLDYIDVPFNPAVAIYQSESSELSGNAAVNRNHFYYSGSAFVDNLSGVSAKIKINDIYVPASGNYYINIKYANANANSKSLTCYTNDANATRIYLPVVSTSWDKWGNYEYSVYLNAGRNSISYQYDNGDTGNINIDRILVSQTAGASVEAEKNLVDNNSFDRTSGLSSNWTEWHPVGQTLSYGIDSGSGSNPPNSPWSGIARAWFWNGSSYQQSIHQVISVPNGTYKVEAWVKYDFNNANTCRLEVGNYGGNQLYFNITKDGVWKYITSGNFTVTNSQVDIGFYMNSPGNTLLLIDEVRLIKQ